MLEFLAKIFRVQNTSVRIARMRLKTCQKIGEDEGIVTSNANKAAIDHMPQLRVAAAVSAATAAHAALQKTTKV